MNDITKETALAEVTAGQSKIQAIAEHIKAKNLRSWDKTTLPVEQKILGGLYFRALFVPAGMLAIGEIHKTESVFFLQQGSCILYNPAESTSKIIYAGFSKVCAPGNRKLVVALEDCVFTSIHSVPVGTTLEDVEDICITNDFNDPVLLENYVKFKGELS